MLETGLRRTVLVLLVLGAGLAALVLLAPDTGAGGSTATPTSTPNQVSDQPHTPDSLDTSAFQLDQARTPDYVAHLTAVDRYLDDAITHGKATVVGARDLHWRDGNGEHVGTSVQVLFDPPADLNNQGYMGTRSTGEGGTPATVQRGLDVAELKDEQLRDVLTASYLFSSEGELLAVTGLLNSSFVSNVPATLLEQIAANLETDSK